MFSLKFFAILQREPGFILWLWTSGVCSPSFSAPHQMCSVGHSDTSFQPACIISSYFWSSTSHWFEFSVTLHSLYASYTGNRKAPLILWRHFIEGSCMRIFLPLHFCSFNTVCFLLLLWFISSFYLSKEHLSNQNPTNLMWTWLPSQRRDTAFHLRQTALRIRCDVMHLKKNCNKVQQRQQTICLSLYLSNHQCCVNTAASAN